MIVPDPGCSSPRVKITEAGLSIRPPPFLAQLILPRSKMGLVLVFLELVDAQGFLLIQPFPP